MMNLSFTVTYLYLLSLSFQCLIEAISTLDVLCTIDSALVPKLFPSIKRVCTRITEESASQPRVMLSLLQFFINHSKSCGMSMWYAYVFP